MLGFSELSASSGVGVVQVNLLVLEATAQQVLAEIAEDPRLGSRAAPDA